MLPQVVDDIGGLLVREEVVYCPVPHGIQQAPNVNTVGSVAAAALLATLGEEEQQQYE